MLFSRFAWLCLLFTIVGAGCGDADAGDLQDSGSAGAGGNAGTAAAGGGAGGAEPSTASFSVTLLDETGLLAERLVMYADADGKHVTTALTSSGGLARFTNVPAGGFVTALLVDSAELISLQTVAGIQDGDRIGLVPAEAFEVPVTAPMGRAVISVSSIPENTERYSIHHPSRLSNYATDAPFSSEVPFSPSAIGPSGKYNALAVAQLAGDDIAFGFAPDLALEGFIPDVTVAGSIDRWEAPSGTIRAELRNVSKVELPVVLLVAGYRDTQQLYLRASSQSMPSGVTVNSELRINASFHDRAIATFVLDVFGSPVALANERFVASTDIPDDGRAEVIWTSTEDFLPSLLAAGHDFAQRSSAYHWSRTPLCDGVAPNVSVLELKGSLQSTRHSWKMLGPYRDELRMPELDPAYAELLFPTELEEEHWTLEARAYPEGSFDSVRRSTPALLPPRSWLARQGGEGAVCVSRARTGGPR